VNDLLIGLVSALVATNQPQAVSNLILTNTGISVTIPDLKDPAEQEYQKILADDDAAQTEVDQWIRENQAFTEHGGGVPGPVLNERITTRFAPIRKAYEDFLQRHPDHVRARLAYGSFLMDIHDEDGAQAEWEKARQLDPKNPAAWNNLADYYTEHSPVKKAFEYYAKASELNPAEPLYYHNLGMVVYLFRKDAAEYYNLTEQQVFDKAFGLYNQALRLDPNNFPLATDLAQCYYGIKPTRTEDALQAWTNALHIARDDVEREGVYVHLARFKLNAERFAEARQQLNAVTNEMYAELKQRLLRNLEVREKQAKETNSPPASLEKK
jgi:tetratricopeptide (TPR) repeat protein